MTDAALATLLKKHLSSLKDRCEKLTPQDMENFTAQLVNVLGQYVDAQQQDIFNELKTMASRIASSRKAVADSLKEDSVKQANAALDSIAASTEKAAHAIMDAAERLNALAAEIPAHKATIEAETAKIFEACSFQDLTGQRVTIVIRTLRDIDKMLQSLLGREIEAGKHPLAAGGLMNGPQAEGEAPDQEAVDRWFDNA